MRNIDRLERKDLHLLTLEDISSFRFFPRKTGALFASIYRKK